MTTLHVIRHGRATAFEADYDQLHAMGELQARALGVHMARTGKRFDAIYVGPLRRQLETLRLMREAAGEVGVSWPVAEVLDGLSEGPFETLMKTYAARRLATDAVLQRHAEAFRGALDDAAREVALSSIFEHVIDGWQRGEISGDDLESAAAFEARVAAALAHIAEREARGRQVAVVTSNGVIAALVARTPDAAVLGQVRLRVHNSSVSLIELGADGPVLRAHDVTEHLTDPQHLTLI